MILLNMQDTKIRQPFGITHGPIRSNSIGRSPKQTLCLTLSKDSLICRQRQQASHLYAGFWDTTLTVRHNSVGYLRIKPAHIAWIAPIADSSLGVRKLNCSVKAN